MLAVTPVLSREQVPQWSEEDVGEEGAANKATAAAGGRRRRRFTKVAGVGDGGDAGLPQVCISTTHRHRCDRCSCVLVS